MAAAVITLAEKDKSELKTRIVKYTFSDSYATGGEALTAADFQLDYLAFVWAHTSAGYVFEYDYLAQKLKAYREGVHTHALHLNNADVADGASARVNAGTNLLGSNTGADIAIAGVANTTGAGGIVQAAQAALAEVSNTVDLSAVSTRIVAFGR